MSEQSTKAPPVETRDLTRDYGATRALDGVTLRVAPGRVVALLGPNGAGKSTFLHLLAGRIAPTAGEARIFGQSARERVIRGDARVASLADGFDPPAWVTPRELSRLEAGVVDGYDATAAEAWCAEHGVPFDRAYGTLSKGQKRWCLAGVLLAGRAGLLLLDEPADGLDPSARRRLYDRIRELAIERGSTAIVATHTIHDVERIADDVAILDGARLRLHASCEALREEVREIELPPDGPEPDLPGSVERLARTREPGATLWWVRSRGDAADLRPIEEQATATRTIGLEALYLALTGRDACEDILLDDNVDKAEDRG